MDPLATRAQLASKLRLPGGESALVAVDADLALASASGLVRRLSRQTISFVSQETIDLPGGERVLRLPQRPLVVDGPNPLTVVELGDFGAPNMTMVEGRDFERIGEELHRGNPWPWTTRLQGWPHRPRGVWAPRVRVTYSHGDLIIGDDVVGVVLDVAGALYDNPTGLRSRSIDDYTETWAVEQLGAVTVEGIKARLGVTGRRRGAATITPS